MRDRALRAMTLTAELSAWLQTTPLFRELSPVQLREIGAIAQGQIFEPEALIFQQGSKATGFFVVKTGRVKVFKLSPQGKEQILHLLGPGEHFAEVPAWDGQDFPASAMALQPSAILFFPRMAFLDLLRHHPEIAIRLLISLSHHARQLSQLVEDLAFKAVPQRLAAYLLALGDRAPTSPMAPLAGDAAPGNRSLTEGLTVVELDLSKSQLAAALGTIPATLSRAFHRLSRDGLIVVRGAQVELCDREGLQSLSESLA